MITGTWLTVAQVAEQLNVRIETVRRWIRGGNLPVLELGGPRTVYRIRKSDLDLFIQERYPDRFATESIVVSDSDDDALETGTVDADAISATDTFETAGYLIENALAGSPVDMVNAMPAAVFRETRLPDGATSFISREVEAILGYGPDTFADPQRSWTSLIHPDDREMVEREMRSTDSTGEPFQLEYRMIHRTGRTVWVQVDAVVTHHPDEDATWDGVLVDISERKRLEFDLQRREAQQRAVADLGLFALEQSTLGPTFQHATDLAVECLSATLAVVYEVQPGGASLLLRAASGTATHQAEPYVSPDPLTLCAFETQSPVVSKSFSADDRFAPGDGAWPAEAASGLAFPIPGTARTFGVLSVFSENEGAFSTEDLQFVQAFVHVIASAVTEAGDQWLTVSDVGAFLQVTEETVRRWIRSGDLPALQLGGARAGYRIYPSDLERFIHNRLIQASRN